jgi:hypothetical protein
MIISNTSVQYADGSGVAAELKADDDKDGVNTRRPYRIDVRHHVLPKLYFEALERLGKTATFGVTLFDGSLESHLEVMDKNKMLLEWLPSPLLGSTSKETPYPEISLDNVTRIWLLFLVNPQIALALLPPCFCLM